MEPYTVNTATLKLYTEFIHNLIFHFTFYALQLNKLIFNKVWFEITFLSKYIG